MQTSLVNSLDDHRDSLHSAPIGREGKYLITVNQVEIFFDKPDPLGSQVLEKAGFNPSKGYVLIELTMPGTRSVDLEKPVDLCQESTQAFLAFESDRVFRFTVDDHVYEWGEGKIEVSELRKVAGVDEDQIIVWKKDGTDVELRPKDIIDLGRSEPQHFRLGNELVIVSIDNEEKKVLAGIYTTEQLICLLDVEDGYVLELINSQGTLTPLGSGETIKIEEGMKFISHVPAGGSS